jgi:Tn3 transposase DDE domain
VFFNRLGELRDRTYENQQHRVGGLNLVVAAIVLWTTVYLEKAIESLRHRGETVDESLLKHLSPLGWEDINLTGDYHWRSYGGVRTGKFRPLRTGPVRKFRNYESMRRGNLHRDHYDLDPFRVLIVTKSAARAATLVDLIAGNRVKFKEPDIMRKLFYVTTETRFLDRPEHIAADIWTPGHRPPEPAAIVPLARR